MSEPTTNELTRTLERFEKALCCLEEAPGFARRNHIGRVLDSAGRVLRLPGGPQAVYALAPRFDGAGVFSGSDWDFPDRLQAGFVPTTFADGDTWTVTLECLSQLRLLAIAEGQAVRSGYSAERAGHYLREVLALCLEYVFER